MATLNVTPIMGTGVQRVGGAQVAKIKGATVQNVSFTGTQGRSTAMPAGTVGVRLVADTTCTIKIGDSTVAAATTDTKLKADTVEYFDIDVGDYISAIVFS